MICARVFLVPLIGRLLGRETPFETVGAVLAEAIAAYDRARGHWTLHVGCQGVFGFRNYLAQVLGVALAAARGSDGLVDPTIGPALIALGYDRDFVDVQQGKDHEDLKPVPLLAGWQQVQLTGLRLTVPAGVLLDLGATAKGLCADWAASAAHAASGAGGVVVSLGGDVAVEGDSPREGWPVLIADDHRLRVSAPGTQVVRLDRGGLATSSITCRQWRRGGKSLHHIIDPRTGRPAAGPWRTVSIAAATCADANAAATAAIIRGDAAANWLIGLDITARLVGRDGRVVLTGGWPLGNGDRLPGQEQRWLRPAGTAPGVEA